MSEKSKLSQAIDLIQSASQEEDLEKRIAIAREAIELSEDCVEAWLFLAQQTGNYEEAKNYLEKGVEAGDRLFAEKKETWKGQFWNHTQTHAYLFARSGLAQVLWELEEYDKSVDVLKESLVLDSIDQQGLRFVLLKALIDLDRMEEVMQLIEDFEDDESTIMLYAKVLASFMLFGDSPSSRSAFIQAKNRNPYVLDYLLRLRMMPKNFPKQFVPGTESEAIRYAAVFMDSWDNTEGAIPYLRAQKKIRQHRESQQPIRKKR